MSKAEFKILNLVNDSEFILKELSDGWLVVCAIPMATDEGKTGYIKYILGREIPKKDGGT